MPKAHWFTRSSDSDLNLPDAVRIEAEERLEAERRRLGKLLAVVEVSVFEHGERSRVDLPSDADPQSDVDDLDLSDVVQRARSELNRFRVIASRHA